MFDNISTVLPSHSTDLERALEQASLWVIHNSEIVDLWNPTTCPPRFLPWLAWSVSVDEWDTSYTDEQKREAVRNSIAVHRLKGTRGAVRRALEAIGFSTDIEEWFDTGEAVHTFRIIAFGDDIFDSGQSIKPELIAKVSRLIDHVKPARSHYSMKVGERRETDVFLGSGSLQKVKDCRSLAPRLPIHIVQTNNPVKSGSKDRFVSRKTHILEV